MTALLLLLGVLLCTAVGIAKAVAARGGAIGGEAGASRGQGGFLALGGESAPEGVAPAVKSASADEAGESETLAKICNDEIAEQRRRIEDHHQQREQALSQAASEESADLEGASRSSLAQSQAASEQAAGSRWASSLSIEMTR